jgi:hypothetical protein
MGRKGGLLPNPSSIPRETDPFKAAQRFLHLLDDLNHMQEELLDEAERLRARVRELEARTGAPVPEGRREEA